MVEYSKALRTDPENLTYGKALERARLRAAEAHAHAARSLAARGLYREALDAFRLARDLAPGSEALAAEVRDTEARLRSGARAPSVDEMKDRTRETALPGLVLAPAAREPLGVSFRDASLREVYQALARVGAVNFVFDPQFQDRKVTLDLRDVPFERALEAVALVGQTFHRVRDPRVLTVVPDTPAKRREYEQQFVKTLFLSNADLKETVDLLRIVLGARRVAPLPGANALTIADAPERVAAAERIVAVIDKQRAEVVVDVEILEVDRSALRDYGIEITSGVEGEGVSGAIAPRATIDETTTDSEGNQVTTTRGLTLADNPYQRSNLVVSSLPGVIYRLLKNDGATRLLANPQLRAMDGQTAQARFGDQVPVPVTVFTPVASGGVAQQPVTSFEYKNVGVNIDLTPRVHHDGDVTLAVKLEISSLGALFQDNPTFHNRSITTIIRLRDGETNILAGLIRDEERTTVVGLPGLSAVPLLGRLFSRNRRETNETDIVMTLTPRIVRRTPLSEEDLRSFPVKGESSPPVLEVPAAPTVPTPPKPEAPRAQALEAIRAWGGPAGPVAARAAVPGLP